MVNTFDAVVVMGGGRNKDDGSLTTLSRARLDSAAAIIKNGLAEHILVMGGKYRSYTPEQGLFQVDGASLRSSYLSSVHGLRADQIVAYTAECRDTFFEVMAAKTVVYKMGWRRILMCTSLNHMSRVLLICNHIFGDSVAFEPVPEPCLDKLNPAQEQELIELTRIFLSGLGKVPETLSWDEWYQLNRYFYKKQRGIHYRFMAEGTAHEGAYASIHLER